jgi:TRAP-type mannitol/chloroaromatic compound transport system permease small subunit
MWPIKVVMCVGIALMLLQALSELAKDILYLKTGEPARADTQAEPGDAL